MNNVSVQTVINIFNNYIDDDRLYFKETICVDEFKNLRNKEGKYAFLIYDPIESKVIDVLPSRRLNTLEDYFYHIPLEERLNVRYFVSDMYEGYRTIKNLFFSNATHIVDSFHYIRYITEAFNKVRIRVMNSFKETDREYKILKRYWRSLTKYSKDLDRERYYYNPIVKNDTNLFKILDDSLNISQELNEAYSYKEAFIKATRTLKYENAKEYIDNWILTVRESEIPEFKELMGLFINWEDEIVNSFIRFGDKRLSNGSIEGINNKIKVIKRVSYGYRNFDHFRKRIMYIINDKIKLK